MQSSDAVSLPGRLLMLGFLLGHLAAAAAQPHPKNNSHTAATERRLPLVYVPATAGNSDCFVILFSGDGGWSGFDQNLCRQMAAQGVSVLGLNSLKYLRTTKTPEQITADLLRLIQLGEARFGKQKVILVGYSCGANLIPFALNRLNETLKERVQYVALLSPEDKADFKFHLYNWIDKNSPRAQLVRPELEKMRPIPTLFIYGDQEDHRWCTDLIDGSFELKTLPGGHHFGHNEALVAAKILGFNPVIH